MPRAGQIVVVTVCTFVRQPPSPRCSTCLLDFQPGCLSTETASPASHPVESAYSLPSREMSKAGCLSAPLHHFQTIPLEALFFGTDTPPHTHCTSVLCSFPATPLYSLRTVTCPLSPLPAQATGCVDSLLTSTLNPVPHCPPADTHSGKPQAWVTPNLPIPFCTSRKALNLSGAPGHMGPHLPELPALPHGPL